MKVSNYLERIGYSGEIEMNIDVLSDLQKLHLLSIPFENLYIHSNTPINLDIKSIYNKIVVNRRGGFCYELNGLFHELLLQLGYCSKMISARVYKKEKGYGKEYDHLVIIVRLNQIDYLVDVGFGEFVFHPLRLEIDIKQEDERGVFFIDKYDDEYYRVNKIVDNEAVPQYIFKTKARKYEEFKAMCDFHQTSPDSHFTLKKFVGIPIENGRITLIGDTLKLVNGSNETERTIEEEEWDDLLVNYFKF